MAAPDLHDGCLLAAILARVRSRTGLDFSRYREPTMRRRVRNRMIALGLGTLEQYAAVLDRDPGEARRLVERLTIKVSRFYRNAAVFDLLRETLPGMAASRAGQPLRIWSAGCGRGEEAYTFAMLLEEAGIEGRVLATDIDPWALQAATEAVYADAAVAELPLPLRERFLMPHASGRHWRVRGAVRERVELCRHDLLGPLQPREGSFDVVACRNVVIYLERDVHAKALAHLRAALAPHGVLVLGEAEWPTPVEAQVEPLSARLRVFRAACAEALAA